MVFEIRPAGPEDAAGIARVWAAALPQLVKTARAIETELRSGIGPMVLIALDGPAVVGSSNIYLPEPGPPVRRARIAIQVPPQQRRRGIGSQLTAAITERAVRAGASKLLGVVHDDDESKGFAAKRGFVLARRMSHSAAELSTAPEPLEPPAGLRTADYDQLEPQQVFEAVVAVRDDDPSGLSGGPAYDEWLAVAWNNPDLRRDLSFAVLDGDRVLSLVSTTADPDRKVIWSNLTGTIPSARGRGLAKVVKSRALAAARDAGFVTASTGNDAANAPMLAVNRWLGYRETSAAWTAEKDL
jgi:GNAT superfamily N-acetyltransferase